jgi:hypothetical protein
MHHGSSEEENSEEEARAQDSRGEEVDGEEDGYRPSQDRQEEIVAKRRGVSAPRLLYSPSKTISYESPPDLIGFAVDVCASRACILLSSRSCIRSDRQLHRGRRRRLPMIPGETPFAVNAMGSVRLADIGKPPLSDRARERQAIVKILLASRSLNDDG